MNDKLAAAIAGAPEKVLVEIVKLIQKQKRKGTKGGWKEFLNVYDRKFGSRISDPAKRPREALVSFLHTFTGEGDLKFVDYVLRLHSNREVLQETSKESLDNESPEQRLVRLTVEHPFFLSKYAFPSHDKDWMVTKLPKKSKLMASNAIIAIDCEMVLCEDGTDALVRVCIVDHNLQVKLDEKVNPCMPVADYRTEITGVSARDLEGVSSSLSDIQKSMKKLLKNGTILVGHGLYNDLQALKVDHQRVIDTSFIFRHLDGRPPSLDALCKSVLGYELRKEGAPHNCVDDACAAMKLVLAKVKLGVEADIPLNNDDVLETEMSKLLLHMIPIEVPPKELHGVFTQKFTIEPKVVDDVKFGGSDCGAWDWWRRLDRRVKERVRAAGFRDFIEGYPRSPPSYAKVMLYGLLELWWDSTHTFHLPCGEMTVTPEDFSAISGLSFQGVPVPFDDRYRAHAASFATEWLGVDLDWDRQGTCSYEKLRVYWMSRLTRSDTVEARDQEARSFIFYLISTFLLPTARSRGDVAYLIPLRDLTRLSSYNWGEMALAHLYYGLDIFSCGGKTDGFSLRFIEVWAHEHQILPGRSFLEDFPGGRIPRMSHYSGWVCDDLIDVSDARRHLSRLWFTELDISPWGDLGSEWDLKDYSTGAQEASCRHFLMRGFLCDTFYLGERVVDYRIQPEYRRVPLSPPRFMKSTRRIPAEELEAYYVGGPAEAFLDPDFEGSYMDFIRHELMPRPVTAVDPPPTRAGHAPKRDDSKCQRAVDQAKPSTQAVASQYATVRYHPDPSYIVHFPDGYDEIQVIPDTPTNVPLPVLTPPDAPIDPATYLDLCAMFARAKLHMSTLAAQAYHPHTGVPVSVASRSKPPVARSRAQGRGGGIWITAGASTSRAGPSRSRVRRRDPSLMHSSSAQSNSESANEGEQLEDVVD